MSKAKFESGARIGALFGGVAMAMDIEHAVEALSLRYPDAVQPGADFKAAVNIPAGERYGVSHGVAVVPVRGILTPDSRAFEKYLGWATYAGIEETAAELAAADDVAAVVLDINSPGGTVLGWQAAIDAIAALAKIKPVYAIANSLAASAAYGIASQATSIAMTPGALVGSIGVMRQGAWPVQPDAWGEQNFVALSSKARAKAPNPTTEIGGAEIQRGLDELENEFHANVAAGRNIPLDDLAARLSVTDDPADGGATFFPADAIKRGLADTMETRAAFYARVMAAHAPKPKAKTRAAYRAQAEAATLIASQ